MPAVKVTPHGVWDLYLRTPETQKKSRILDVFLWLVLKEARGKEDISELGDMTGICNQLVQEFMSGILRITNDANEDDLKELQDYLLGGQGVYLLKVIQKIGVKDLSNGRNFANLLVSLVSWCLKFGAPNDTLLSEDGIDSLSISLKKCQLNYTTPSSKLPHALSKCHKEYILAISRWQLLYEYMSLDPCREPHKSSKHSLVEEHSTSDSDGIDLSDSQTTLKGKQEKKRKCRLGETQFLSWQNRYQPLIEENLKGIQPNRCAEILHPAETCLVMTDIIHNVCLLDMNQTSTSKVVSIYLLPELLDGLSRFHDMFHDPDPDVWTKEMLAYIMKNLIQLVFMLSNIAAKQQNGSSILIRTRIFPSLLYLAHDLLDEEIIYPDQVDWMQVSELCHIKMVLVSDLLSGLVLCATEMFQNVPLNSVFINNALRIMRVFKEETGFDMLELIISWLDSGSFPHSDCKKFQPRDDLMKAIGGLIIAMKRTKVGYIHALTCMKRKHRKCVYTHCFDHHHDVLGLAFKNVSSQYNKPEVPLDSCLVAVWSLFLLNMLPTLKSKQLQLQTLTLFVTSGICCCLGIESVLASFYSSLSMLSPAAKNYALDIMNKMLLEQLSGSRNVSMNQSKIEICQLCEENLSDDLLHKSKLEYEIHLEVTQPEAPDSGVSSSEVSSEDFRLSQSRETSTRWESLDKMRDILYSEDSFSASLLSKHFLILAVNSRKEVKQELYFSIYYPILVDYCKWKSSVNNGFVNNCHVIPCPVGRMVIINCLSAFPYLLQAESVMAAFLARHGIEKLWTILEDDSLQELVLHVFEVLIISDEEILLESMLKENRASERFFEENSPMSDFSSDDDVGLSSNNGNSSSTVIRSFLKILAEKIKRHGALINIIPETSALPSNDSIGTGYQHNKSNNSSIEATENDKSPSEDQLDTRLEQLRLTEADGHHKWFILLTNLWRTCQVLLLNSPSFLLQFKKSDCFTLAKDILFHIIPQLKNYADPEDPLGEFTSPKSSNFQPQDSVDFNNFPNVPIFQQVLSLLESVLVACIVCYLPVFTDKWELKDFHVLLSDVKNGLKKCQSLQANNLQQVFDSLLRCAKPERTTILELSSLHTLLMCAKEEDLDDEEEVCQLLQQGVEAEMEYFFVECGYDADSEFSLSEDLRGKNSRSSDLDFNLTRIHFASIYRLVVELLIDFSLAKSAPFIFHRVLYQLVQTCREDQGAVEAMSSEGIVELLLEGLRDDLLGKTNIKKDTRILLFTLVQLLSQDEITSKELKLLLHLFMEDEPPQELLLSTLTGIVENYKVTPIYSLQFPVVKQETVSTIAIPSNCGNNLRLKGVPIPDNESEVTKVSSLAPLCMRVSSFLPWPPYQTGFSISVWIRLGEEVVRNQWVPGNKAKTRVTEIGTQFDNGDYRKSWLRSDIREMDSEGRSSISDECLHVLSVGTDEKILEIWTDPCVGTLVVRLTSHSSTGTVILKECSAPSLFSPDRWHHLVLKYHETLEENILSGKVSLILDGWWSQEMILDHPSDIRLTQVEPSVYIGHARSYKDHLLNRKKSFYLGPLMLFKGTSLSQEVCFHLHSLGPNCISISKCDCSEQKASYIPSLSKNVICFSGVSTDTLVEINQVSLDSARSNLVLIYNPQYPKLFSLYCSGGSGAATMASNSLNLTLGLLPHIISQSNDLLEQHPFIINLQTSSSVDIVCKMKNTLEKSTEEIGGINVFIFLVAKVFESCHPLPDKNSVNSEVQIQEKEKLQSAALNLLFQIIKQIPSMCAEYIECQGDRMISRVLESCKSLVSFRTLKVLFDAATTESVLHYDPSSNSYVIREQTVAIIQNMSVIENLLLKWRIWIKGNQAVMELLFKTLECLVRDGHPHQEFNIKQYQAGNFVQKIFLMYQELLRDHLPAPSTVISTSIVAIIQKLVGSPPDSHLIVAVCDFLLLMHPAADTYINYTRSGFYFNCWWGVPGTPVGKRYSKKKRRIDQVQLASLSDYKNGSDEEKKGLFRTVSFVSKTKPIYERQIGATRPRSASYPTNNEELREWKTQKDKHNYAEQFQEISKTTTTVAMTTTAATTVPAATTSAPPRPAAAPASIDLQNIEKQDEKPPEEILYLNDYHGSWEIIVDVDNLQAPPGTPELSFATEAKEMPALEEKELSDKDLQKTPSSLSESLTPTSIDEASSFESEEEDDENPHKNQNYDDVEKGLVILYTGLLDLLCTTLVMFDESRLEQLLCNVINARVLIVLANNSSAKIRALVVRLLDIYLQRCRNNHVDVFLKMNGFHLLATQLYSYPSEKCIIDMAFSILLAKPYQLNEDCDFSQFQQISQVQQCSAPLLLSLIEKSSEDFNLCHSLISVLVQLFDAGSVICSALIENGFTECLCNLLAKLNQGHSRPLEERQTAFDDVKQLFTVTALREFSLSGNSHFQNFEEILSLLKALEEREKIVHGPSSIEVKNIKSIEYNILHQSLLFVEQPQENSGSPNHWSRTKTNFFPLGKSNNKPKNEQNNVKSKELKNTQWTLLPLPDPTDKFLSNISQWSTLWGQKKKKETNKVSASELSERLKKLIKLAVDLTVFADKDRTFSSTGKKITFVFNGPNDNFTSDNQFQNHLLEFLVKALAQIQDKGILHSRKPKVAVFYGAKDTLIKQTARLIVSMLSPMSEFYQRTFVVTHMMKEMKHREIFKSMFASSPLANVVSIFFHEMLTSCKDQLSNSQQDNAHCLLGLLKKSGSRMLFSTETYTPPDKSKIDQEIKSVYEQVEEEKQEWLKRRHHNLSRILYIKNESLIKSLADSAMEVTQQVFRMQNKERKELVTHLKQSMTDKIQIKKSWQDLVQQLTHEKAIWFCSKSYPCSWQLDPTEGPCRIRKRLQRCHLGIDEKYISPDCREKLSHEKVDPPLIYLFEDDHQTSDSAALIYRLYTSEKIQYTCGCTTVSPSAESKGDLLIGEQNVYFIADMAVSDLNYTQVLLGNKDQLSMTWPQMDIKEFLPRWFQLKDVGLEIFLTNGKTCLLAFNSTEERNQTMKQMETLELPNLVKGENLSSIQQLWCSGRMTNFEYLTHLNKIAGRSFNDLMQYPVFPFIIRDYIGSEVDLSSQSLYRDLSKPIAVQDKSREKKYIENYQYLKQEYEKFLQKTDETFYRVAPYHYGSHYSNSGTVLHFLVRLPPFTKMFLNFQDNHFDLPDRTFHSMAITWKLSSYQSTSDVKELIPEFFFQPEMFVNSEGFDFGVKQTGDVVWNVELPNWCQGNPRLFILIHRQALESPYVTENIHQWINLVFGYKQQGESAVQAINIFHPATYFGVDVDSEKDPVHRQALITMVKTYGQTPKQLLRTPHPQLPPYLLGQIFPNLANGGKFLNFIASLSGVRSLHWGDYIGSPDCAAPAVIHRKETKSHGAATLLALPTGEVFGIKKDSCLLTMCSKDRGVIGIPSTDIVWAGIISWKHPDGILRITNNPEKNPVNFLQLRPYDQTTCIASVPDCRLLFIGGTAGVVTVYTSLHNTAKKSHLQILGLKKHLYGHSKPITTIKVCKSYSILVSASEDGLCIIWDLNRLSYVRSIESHQQSVNTVAISETLGDIITISHRDSGSSMHLHTINAQLVAVHNCEDRILCAAYSSAPEGRSINVIAGGLSSGIVRLWNSWTLEPVRDLVDDAVKGKQILSLTFTQDSQHLCVSASDGIITFWGNQTSKPRPPRLVLFL